MWRDFVILSDHFSLFSLFRHSPLRIIRTSAIKGNLPHMYHYVTASTVKCFFYDTLASQVIIIIIIIIIIIRRRRRRIAIRITIAIAIAPEAPLRADV